MALDTYDEIAGKVILRCPAAGILLARDWVNNAFRQVAEYRLWSWQTRREQFVANAVYNDGTVAVTHNSTTVTGTGTVFTAAMQGRQFRLGSNDPVYTIATRNSNTEIVLDREWGGATASGQSYEIWNAYFTAPTDFHSFVSVWDPNFNWQLHLHVAQEEINSVDSQRSNAGTSYVIADLDYTTIHSGRGSIDGTTVTIPLPRYEIWPHQKGAYVWPFLYKIRATDLEDSGALLPRYIRGDVLLELALMEAASWPGTASKKNPYASQSRADHHYRRIYGDRRFPGMLAEMARQDDEVFEQDIAYITSRSFAPYPFYDTDFMQSHDFQFV